VEICGPGASVLKLLPPLTVSAAELAAAFEVLGEAVREPLRAAA
jgi:4-aminobutyrate aminotransferase-like enzyme